MNIVAALSGIIILMALIVIIISLNRKYNLGRILLYSTILLFSWMIVLMALLYILDKGHKEIYLSGENLYDGVLHFLVWYYYVPSIFLIVTLLYYILKHLKKVRSTEKQKW